MTRFLAALIILGLFACGSDKKEQKQRIETAIYAVKGNINEYQKDSLQFLEVEYYNEAGLLEQKDFFTSARKIKGYEKYLYKNGSNNYYRSEYFDGNDSLLSYYKHHYNQKNLRASSSAYRGANDEFLRIERYYYDDNKNRTGREIRTTENEVQRRFDFTFDKYGNEKEMKVSDAEGTQLFKEFYEITRKNKDNEWMEKWGFVGNTPNSYRKREWVK